MYSSKTVNEKITEMLKIKGISKKIMLAACDANENVLNQMSDKKGISSFTLAKIADELNCSVDYLLGRSENPMVNNSYNISTGDIMSGDNSHFSGNNVTVGSKGGGDDAQELLNMITQLSLVQRAEIILKINEMLNEK